MNDKKMNGTYVFDNFQLQKTSVFVVEVGWKGNGIFIWNQTDLESYQTQE